MRILIVGAGIAGLATAKFLEILGIECEIIDQNNGPVAGGGGILLLGNATRVLGEMGLLEQTESVAVTIRAQRILNASGVVLSDYSIDSLWKDCGPCFSLPKHKLVSTIRDSLQQVKVSYRKTIVAVNSTLDRKIVHFSDGEAAEFDIVIGADGAHSPLRRMVFGEILARRTNVTCFKLSVENSYGVDRKVVMLGRDRALIAVPISETHIDIHGDFPSTSQQDNQISNLREAFVSFRSPLAQSIVEAELNDSSFISPLKEVRHRHWIADRVTLIGGAAHASSPRLAQGAAMALEDAIVLAQLIARRGSIPLMLYRFHELRAERVAWVQKNCHTRDFLSQRNAFFRDAILRKFGAASYRRTYGRLSKPLPSVSG
jgi:2-polyprenyl-6-methoxyphenol hydroxylase-like FAD-dependent oxidoreductase